MSRILGIKFNGKHSYYDIGVSMEYFKPQLPQPKTIEEEVPGVNGDGYDFSTILTNGEPVYTGRNLVCKFNLKGKDKIALEQRYTKVSEWLLGSPKKVELISDSIPGYFFMAKVKEIPEWEETKKVGFLTVTFRAEPYKQGTELAGDLLWDHIDFELPDFIQETKFTINGNKSITLYVSGSHSIIPKVVVDSSMSCTVNNYTAVFSPTKNTNWAFKLKPGANTISISGTGNIDFQFRKEVL
ncbi:MAG: putative phage tail component [Anaerocolumna sp.]|jgi:phage-related protein|nr:putative phage tail component [Anaerocolumna sp.]